MVSPRKTQQLNTLFSAQPTFSGASKHPNVSRGYCFFINLRDDETAQVLKKRIDDLGLRRERCLSERVTHVISDGGGEPCGGAAGAERSARAAGRRRADAMLERLAPSPYLAHVTLSVQKAIILLDKIYDSLYKVLPPIKVKILKAPFIKFEPIDRSWRPVYKELETWPEIAKEPELPAAPRGHHQVPPRLPDRMTRKHRARKEETKETKGGYCEMCNADYIDVMVHRRSPQHLAFIRDSNNFRSLDALIQSTADVSAFLDKTTPVNGERRSLRKLCNGDTDHEHSKPPTNGAHSPRANGQHLDTRKSRSTRCRKNSGEPVRTTDERHYYKVIGVNTKLRSSGGFAAPRRDSPPPTCNGGSPGLVVKFRKVRRSELSVLSDEAEQFMFPHRASSSSSEDEREAPPTHNSERRRTARPTALKEESSDEDSSHEDIPRRRKRGPPKKIRLAEIKSPPPKSESPPPPETPVIETEETPTPQEEVKEKCLKWEDGRLKAAPVVEELQFAFESVPKSEPWYETFTRQDHNKPLPKNVPQFFALYASSPKLPYEMGQLPPLKPNCCPLSDLVKREEKPGPSRSYGTRGNKKQRIRKRTAAALIALEKHPRKSPREHASTLAILGGLLHRRKHQDDTKSTASEDTCSEANSNVKSEQPQHSQTQEQSERLQQFLSEVFEDAAEYEVAEDSMEGEATVATSTVPDIVHLVSECENCDIIRDEVREGAAIRTSGPGRRGYKFKKKNRTGWPNKKKVCMARIGSADPSKSDSVSCNTIDAQEETNDPMHDSASELDESTMASNEEASEEKTSSRSERDTWRSSERRSNCTETDGSAEEGGSETGWGAAALQPVVRVAKMDPGVGRTLRSAAASGARTGGTARRGRAYRFR